MSTWWQSQHLCHGSVCRSGRCSDQESAELDSVLITALLRRGSGRMGDGQELETEKERTRYSQPDILMPVTFGVEFGFGIV